MSASIDNTLITQFSDSVHVAAQQIRARLRGSVIVKPMTGDVFAYDGLGTVDAYEVLGRYQPVTFSEIEHKRRKIARRRFVLTLPIDASDVRGALLNPQSDYAAACVRAMERVFDRIVVESLFATVYTGREFATSVNAATDGVQTVNATGGLTYEKLLEVAQNFMDMEVGTDSPEKFVMGISGDEHTALMKSLELVSGDYSRQYVVDKGQINTAIGIDLIKFAGQVTRPILNVSGGVRDCFVMSTRGICVGMSKELGLKIENRTDLIETTQVQITFQLGATRTEGVLVQKVTTTD